MQIVLRLLREEPHLNVYAGEFTVRPPLTAMYTARAQGLSVRPGRCDVRRSPAIKKTGDFRGVIRFFS